MRSIWIAIALIAVAGAARPYPTAAQQASSGNYGWGVSYMTFSPFIEADSAVIAEDLQLDPGLAFAAYAEKWFGASRFVGVQLGAVRTRRPLKYPTDTRETGVTTLALRGLARLVAGRSAHVMPFVSAGGGLTWYDFGDGPTVRIPQSQVIYTGDQNRQWTLIGGGGIDIFPGTAWPFEELGIRLEVVDQVTLERPFDTVEGLKDDPAHNLRFGVSLQASPVW